MKLYVLRHGEAGKRLPAGSRDSERALTISGEEEVAEVANGLSKLKIKLDFVATSPLKRSRQTAEILVRALKVKKNNLEEWDELKPEGKKLELYRRLSKFKQQSSVLVVGHEPYLSTMIADMVFANSGGHINLKKAGVARVEITSFQPSITADLRWLLTPKHLKKIAG